MPATSSTIRKCWRCGSLFTRNAAPSIADLCPVCLPHRAFTRPWGEGLCPKQLISIKLTAILITDLIEFERRGRGHIISEHAC